MTGRPAGGRPPRPARVDCLVNGRSAQARRFLGRPGCPSLSPGAGRAAGRVSRSSPSRRSRRRWPRPGGLRAAGSGGRPSAGCPVDCPGGLLAALRPAGGGRWPGRPILGRWRARWRALAGREGIGQAGRSGGLLRAAAADLAEIRERSARGRMPEVSEKPNKTAQLTPGRRVAAGGDPLTPGFTAEAGGRERCRIWRPRSRAGAGCERCGLLPGRWRPRSGGAGGWRPPGSRRAAAADPGGLPDLAAYCGGRERCRARSVAASISSGLLPAASNVHRAIILKASLN